MFQKHHTSQSSREHPHQSKQEEIRTELERNTDPQPRHYEFSAVPSTDRKFQIVWCGPVEDENKIDLPQWRTTSEPQVLYPRVYFTYIPTFWRTLIAAVESDMK